jgi:hypothetical protein
MCTEMALTPLSPLCPSPCAQPLSPRALFPRCCWLSGQVSPTMVAPASTRKLNDSAFNLQSPTLPRDKPSAGPGAWRSAWPCVHPAPPRTHAHTSIRPHSLTILITVTHAHTPTLTPRPPLHSTSTPNAHMAAPLCRHPLAPPVPCRCLRARHPGVPLRVPHPAARVEPGRCRGRGRGSGPWGRYSRWWGWWGWWCGCRAGPCPHRHGGWRRSGALAHARSAGGHRRSDGAAGEPGVGVDAVRKSV